MSYGPDIDEMAIHSIGHADKILRGAKPGDIPIELPKVYELVISAKNAKALGLTVPKSLLVRADHVIT